MDSTRPALAVLASLLIVWWLHMRHFLQRLPERIATHFDGAGVPNGWMPRAELGTFNLMLMLFVLAVIVGSAFLTRLLPVSLINIPHREYWFAPERRRQSHDRMMVHMLWLACLMVAFLTAVNQLVFMANLRPGHPHLPSTGLIVTVGGLGLGLAGWVVLLYRMFPRPAAPMGARRT